MSIIRQRSRQELTCIESLSPRVVIDDPGTITPLTHRAVLFNQATGAAYHNDYVVGLSNGSVSVASEAHEGSVDISDWPIIKRGVGFNGITTAKFTNGRSTTSEWEFNFTSYGGQTLDMPAHDVVEGSLLDYTLGIVDGIASGMVDNKMWDSYGNRAQTEVIPHAYWTGQVWDGKWGSGGGAGTTAQTGRRFMAITPRHLFSCGHYQYRVGDVLLWKDINNNIISRRVQGVVNLLDEMRAAGFQPFHTAYDMSMTLLEEDLPPEIHILPVIGPWAKGVVSVDASTHTRCTQIAGFALFNHDGHLGPFLNARNSDDTSQRVPITFEGINFDFSRLIGVSGTVNPSTTLVNWPSGPGEKFYHHLRGGDSGLPCVVPCAEGWAYSGHVSTGFHPEPELMNELIELTDFRYGISTGYTVTVATDPTL